MRPAVPLIAVIAMGAMLWHPHVPHCNAADTPPTVNAPPKAEPGPCYSSAFATRDVVRRSLEESSLLQVFIQAKSAIRDQGRRSVSIDQFRGLSFAGILQSSSIRLQI
jgi:hypothetical protein